MDIKEYHERSIEAGYIEEPTHYSGFEVGLQDFVDFNSASLELNLYLNKLILCRSFYGTYTSYYKDVKWFSGKFFNSYMGDLNRPELSNAIKEAVAMIFSDERFTKVVIATPFMFGVIEFYIKFNLGFRPMRYGFFDTEGKRSYIKQHDSKLNGRSEISLRKALELLQKTSTPIASALNEIDMYTARKLRNVGIPEDEKGWVKYGISDRLNLIRNPLVHGENHSLHGIGEYLVLLYTLFHLHDLNTNKIA